MLLRQCQLLPIIWKSLKYRLNVFASYMEYQIFQMKQKAFKVHFSHIFWPIFWDVFQGNIF